MKTVSVIIPCYNGEAVIDRAISSIYTQDYGLVELVVVDDGSVDNSKSRILSWVEAFEKKGWVLHYVFQENKGLGGAINTGLKYVSGDYISLLDADDEYLPGSVCERAAYLDAHPECDVVRSNGWSVKGQRKHLFICEQKEKERKDVFVALLKGETNNWAGSYMVRAESLFRFYPDREIYTSRYGQNLQFLLPLTYSKHCGFIDKPFMNYIHQENSLTRTADEKLAKKRALENAAGYRDIRIYMTKLIVTDAKEQSGYLKMIDAAYWRSIMNLADIHEDENLLKEAYDQLKQIESPSIYDRILYFRKVRPAVAFLLRAWNKVVCIVGNKNA